MGILTLNKLASDCQEIEDERNSEEKGKLSAFEQSVESFFRNCNTRNEL